MSQNSLIGYDGLSQNSPAELDSLRSLLGYDGLPEAGESVLSLLGYDGLSPNDLLGPLESLDSPVDSLALLMIAFLPWIVLSAKALVMTAAFIGETLMNEKSSIIFKSSISLLGTPDSFVISSKSERAVYHSLLPNAMNNLVCPHVAPVLDLLANLFSLPCSTILRYLV